MTPRRFGKYTFIASIDTVPIRHTHPNFPTPVYQYYFYLKNKHARRCIE